MVIMVPGIPRGDRGNGDKYLGVTKSHTWKSFKRKINAKDVELFRKGSVHKFYHLKALITLEQVNTSVVEKKKNLQ